MKIMKYLKNKFLPVIIILSTVIIVASSCSQASGAPENSVEMPATSSLSQLHDDVQDNDGDARIFVDLQGNEVELPVEINKVVHLWPASTALQVFLGSGDKIIGTLTAVRKGWGWLTSACPRLLEVQGFSGEATAEELLVLEPDVVITSNAGIADNLRNAGVPVVCMLAGEDMDSLKEMILKMGELLGEFESAKATQYISYLDDIIHQISGVVASIPEEDRVAVYYNSAQHGESPLLTCGDGSIVDTWMQVVGCKNVVAGIVKGMDKEVDMEVIIEADPDYILVGGTYQDTVWEAIQTDPAWQGLTAVREGRVIHNPQGVMKWEKFGVEIALQMLWFTEQIYPDKLDVDIEQTIRDFYLDYYGYDLSDADYADLLSGKSSPGANRN